MPPKSTNGKPNPKEPEPGLICSRCGCNHFYTLRTLKQTGEQIMRQKECRHCGKRIVTYEKAAFR